ncbi:DNA polymerase III subunit beta [Gemmatimonas sp.]|jgi:DNA polymerase-3 subunit beta|uniref:DNA polymerase III subunit beta n=1 Tax=Gemmatimonas sp. TaxID=1962908 RepID=UPI0022C22034|nr:DNA polymerase III subunit beta [Gemmatimonas sp.]MCA2983212.1 DNA polymerase III subunit beta [Gemmatimonas sp.]MCA2986459.1 DNA polymerase III subunit beta [Gemmatimonas sp.]MCA2990307.1 DNA polymerase III subunit beta [Gemmatimonas sp.]MCA2993482.1 DNA polymerase III subunit beta [Gemmatimonas sp.]MCE2952102.1 DNA polymerase III subunit beta [Gemmatimonas sp.]
MKFTISREKLQEGLQAVTAAVPAKTTLPVLANLLVETTDRGIRFSATDLDIAVSTEVSADVETPGAITIPAKKLSEIARELPPSPVKIATSGEQRVTLECGRSKFKLLGLPRDEFPTFPSVRFNDSWRVKSGELQKLIAHTAFAVSTEESRPILNGVLWELREERMRMVATNGHRLAKMELPVEASSAPPGDLIVPPKALEQIRRLFPAEEELEIARGDNHLGFRSPFTSVFTRLVEGPYPNYEQVIPKDNDRYALADKAALTQALKRMSVIASDQTHRIKMSFNTGMLKFSVTTPDLGEASDELPVNYTGDQLDIGFNATYLLEILRFMPTEQVRLTFKAPERAATIEPEGWDDPAKYLCLVMPLRLMD